MSCLRNINLCISFTCLLGMIALSDQANIGILVSEKVYVDKIQKYVDKIQKLETEISQLQNENYKLAVTVQRFRDDGKQDEALCFTLQEYIWSTIGWILAPVLLLNVLNWLAHSYRRRHLQRRASEEVETAL